MSRVGIAYTEERRQASSARQKKLWQEIETVVKRLYDHSDNPTVTNLKKGHIQGLRNHDLIKNNWAFLVRGPRGKNQNTSWDRLSEVILRSAFRRVHPQVAAEELGYTIKNDKRLLMRGELPQREQKDLAKNEVVPPQPASVPPQVKDYHPAGEGGTQRAWAAHNARKSAQHLSREVTKSALQIAPGETVDEKIRNYETSASHLRMAIWFIKQVGDVERARELLTVAADAMSVALQKV